jgi:CDP-diacylglycerol---serine O-phosphatidyltransferase
MTRHIPNFLTCCNLLCGCIGIVFCLENRAVPAAYFVWAGGVFDFFDGFAARILKVSSPIGKELDSLADVITFGILPSLVMYKMIGAVTTYEWLPYFAFLIAVCSALRLAVFNVDETQHDSFKGLNTPANTIFITSLVFLPPALNNWVQQEWTLVLITLVFSLLLVSRIDIIAFKFKNFSWANNKARFTFLPIAVLLIAFMGKAALPFVILFYIIFSLVSKALKWVG